MDYFTVGKLEDFEPGEVQAFLLKGRDIAVVKVGDAFYAFDNCCTHEGVSFSSGVGLMTENSVTCMLHGSTFSTGTGEVLGGPALDPLSIYDVQVRGNDVQIGVG